MSGLYKPPKLGPRVNHPGRTALQAIFRGDYTCTCLDESLAPSHAIVPRVLQRIDDSSTLWQWTACRLRLIRDTRCSIHLQDLWQTQNNENLLRRSIVHAINVCIPTTEEFFGTLQPTRSWQGWLPRWHCGSSSRVGIHISTINIIEQDMREQCMRRFTITSLQHGSRGRRYGQELHFCAASAGSYAYIR